MSSPVIKESNMITKADIIFLALLLIYGNQYSAQQVILQIPIYGEINNNRQCDNRLLFIEFIMHFIYNYIQNTFTIVNGAGTEYEISINPDNNIVFICSPNLSNGIVTLFNLSQPNALAWLLNLPRGNKQVFIKYLLVFMNFSNSKTVFYKSRNEKLTVTIIYKLMFEYYESMRSLISITDPINIGASNYGFKLDIYKVITNNLIINHLKLINLFPTLFNIPYPDHLEYAISYIKITYDHYLQFILDNSRYEPENDVFI